MKLYIDCGSHNGDTLDCKSLFNFEADYKIAFEPNLNYFEQLEEKANETYGCAVWVSDGLMPFSLQLEHPHAGSSLMKSKKSYDSGEIITVPTIDFSDFLEDVYDRLEVSHLVVRMDIEGSEFPVLEHLIKNNTDKLINKLFVETHENKVRDYTTTYKNDLLKRLRCVVEEIR